MAKFPQLDWVAINGRDTPFTKPQHYKEGSTSETDLTGHDNPLPTTDKSVRAELESIKATQDKILKRLDEPLPTQLTGSNVEDGLPVKQVGSNTETIVDENFLVGKDTSKGFLLDLDATKYMMGIFTETNDSIDFSFRYRLRSSDGTWLSVTKILTESITIPYGVSEITEVQTPQIYFMVRNNSKTDDLIVKKLLLYKMR